MFGFMADRNRDLIESKKELNKDRTCLLLSSLLTSAFVNGGGLVVNFSISYNATINATDLGSSYKGLDVGDSYCLLPINTVPNKELEKGTIEIENLGNSITIKNV